MSVQGLRQRFSSKSRGPKVKTGQDGGDVWCFARCCIRGFWSEMVRFLRNHAVCSYFSRKLYCEILHFYSFQKPEGLIRLLRAFALKPGETPEQGRARLYRRIWAILWVSWTVSRRFQSSGYLFPARLLRSERSVEWNISGGRKSHSARLVLDFVVKRNFQTQNSSLWMFSNNNCL